MSRRRGPAVAIPLLMAVALATAGCGLGAGRGLGEAELTVTRDFGTRRVAGPVRDRVTESDTAMRLLERKARISTRYGGGFVQSIDGIAGEERAGRRYDWFFYVNGVEATTGAADYALHGGDAVWWDYRDWSAALAAPAVVGSWPQPLVGGYDGKRRPVAVECMDGGSACAEVRDRLDQAGVRGRLFNRFPDEKTTAVGEAAGKAPAPAGAIRVLVGPWARLRRDPAAARIERGPRASGVFAEFTPTSHRSAVPFGPIAPKRNSGSFELWGLDEAGKPVGRFGPDAGLVAATRHGEEPPVWVVTGATERGVRAAADLLDSHDLRDRYAVAVEAGEETPLPAAPVFVRSTRVAP